jgi:sugar/nucleoside kinase (ribokinase family)
MSKIKHCVSFHIVGDAFVDLFCFVEGNLPELGGDSRLSRPVETFAGGSATNSATHLQDLIRGFGDNGAPLTVNLHTAINPDDDYGRLMLDHAANHGYKFYNCKRKDTVAATGHCLVIVCQGDRSFMTHQGCVEFLEASDIELESTVFPSAKMPQLVHLHFAGYYNTKGFWNGKLKEKVLGLRRQVEDSQSGSLLTISLVPQHDASGEWDGGLRDLLPLLDVVIMNDMEAKHIAGEKDDEDSIQQWLKYFSEVCAETWIIVTRGRHGAIAMRQGGIRATQHAVVVEPVDPTGAGDAFVAGFIYGLWQSRFESEDLDNSKEWSTDYIRHGLWWGCAVGTCSVLTRGASVPSAKSDIESFLKQTKCL